MASEKVSALTEASSLGQSDALYVVQNNVSKKIPVSKLGAAIKLTNIIIPGLGFTYDSSSDPSIYIYDSNSNLDPILEIDASSGLLIRGESSGSTTIYHNVSWDALANIGAVLSYDMDNTRIETGDSYISVTDKTTSPNQHGELTSASLEFSWGNGQDWVQITNKGFKKLDAMIPNMGGLIKCDNGYYVSANSKKPEAVVVELYKLDPETAEITNNLAQGAKYRSDGIEFYNENGSIGYAAAADIAALGGLGSYTGDLATLLQDLDDRITALENA